MFSMCYHTSLLQIYFFLKTTAPESTESEAAAHARHQCFSLAKQITSLITLHRSKWGIERMSPTTIQWVSTSLFALLDGLDNTDNRNAFIELCTVARAFCQRWTLPKGILRMIQLTASQRGIQLPGEVEALFMDFESQNWDRKDREKFSRSGYPNFAAIHKRDGDHEMDKFLEKWDTLSIEG